MLKVLTTCCLVLTCLPVLANKQEAGEEYRNWCTHSAKAERIALDDQAEFIQECIDTLVEADNNHEGSDKRREGRRRQADSD